MTAVEAAIENAQYKCKEVERKVEETKKEGTNLGTSLKHGLQCSFNI